IGPNPNRRDFVKGLTLVGGGLALLGLESCSKSTSPAWQAMSSVPDLKNINHFIFIMQENRSFDHYFGTYPGAEGLPAGVSFLDPHDGTMVSSYHDTNDINLVPPEKVDRGST